MAKLSALLPLLFLLFFVAIASYIGYQLYLWSNEVAARGKKSMEKKNLAFTSDGGLRVGVKEMRDEKYADKTQNVLVNVWNNASLPNYKSRLGWNSTQQQPQQKRPAGGSRTPSNSTTTTKAAPPPSSLLSSGHDTRPAVGKRTPSTPGGWD